MATQTTPKPLLRSVPLTPTEEVWRTMTPAERESLLVEVIDTLSDAQLVLPEGRPHQKAKSSTMDMLGLHFRTMGRTVYLAEEMAVLYPGEAPFSPDVLAVLEVQEPEDDQRMAWVVADEGKGVDWVLEVLWAGDRKKDLVDNVESYARLGIPEYFVYDRRNQRIHAYRLGAGTGRYQPILAQAGAYHSNVLGVELAIVESSLHFFQGAAELVGTVSLIHRLKGMMQSLDARAEQASIEAEEARRDAETARQEAEMARRDAEKSSRDAETSSQGAEQALTGLRRAIVGVLASRGITCSQERVSQLEACAEPDMLNRWMQRALAASSEAEVFSADGDC